MDQTIAIIGAGPAGSMLAYKLATGGKKILLYDPKAPWEKPCGGMLSPETIHDHPELEDYPYPLNSCHGIDYISPRNHRKFVASEKLIPVVSRLELNRFLLDLARNSGAAFIRKKVLGISREESEWVIETNDGSHKAGFVVGADGVNSLVRKATVGKFPEEHLALTCGYFLTSVPDNQYVTKFIDAEGYLFVISRADHASAGIGAKLGAISSKHLFKKLDNFLHAEYPGFKITRKYSALIPTATDEGFFDLPCCSDNWLLVGDAAGHVDPAVGEGVYYALESAKIAAQAILDGDIHSYDVLWQDRYGSKLKQGASFRKRLSILAGDNPEMFGLMMFNRAIGGLFI